MVSGKWISSHLRVSVFSTDSSTECRVGERRGTFAVGMCGKFRGNLNYPDRLNSISRYREASVKVYLSVSLLEIPILYNFINIQGRQLNSPKFGGKRKVRNLQEH